MIFRQVQIIVLILLLSSCNMNSSPEESVIILNPEKKSTFIKMLDEKGVNYRIQTGDQIFYSVEQKDIVVEVFEKAVGRKVPDYEPNQ